MRRLQIERFLRLLAVSALLAGPAAAQSNAGGGSGGSGGSTTITGNLPPFAQTPTFNVGTIAGIATDASVQAVKTALGSPFQAGASIGNTAFGISGTLPAFAATPTFNIGALNGAATAANQATEIAALQAVQQRAALFADATNQAIAAGATTYFTIQDLGAAPKYSRFNVGYFLTQPGTVYILGSNDNFANTVFLVNTAVAANGSGVISTPVSFRYYRAAVGNGSTAGAITVGSGFSAN